MNHDQELRRQLVNLLMKEQAHLSFEHAVADFPVKHINDRPLSVIYTFWQLIEHLRITQWDILDYIVNPNYKWQEWPAGYWPDSDATTDAAGWQRTIDQFLADRQALVDIVQDPKMDWYAQIPHGSKGHNILREIHVVAAHNSYHIGELGILREMTGTWGVRP